MAKETPFVPVKVKCPFCEAESVQRYIKSRMYQPEIVEEDSHVATYKWENPEFVHIRPNFYHIWHCPNCHFCDETETFRGEDKSGGKQELIREKLLIYSRMPNSFIARLGAAIDFGKDEYSVDSALAAHILAIYEQELLSPNMRQFNKLARFYLRTAWLFREKRDLSLMDASIPGGFESFQAFLESFKAEWPGVPLEERAALETALLRYQDILNHSSNTDVKFEINVMNLIIAMLRRMGRNAEALRAVRGVFSTAAKARQSARAAVQKGVNVAQNQGILNFAAGVIDKSTALAEELGEIVFKEELPAAREAVLKMGPVDAKTVLDKLREQKFSDITCRRLSKMFEKQAQTKK
ncbi:MAG: DUF2225 domain-containing protein [Planctomycetota bacterium]|jgi:hypothetical protein|nr:DUF2225 domain-containing protein [Planctomycetota bacterium]